MIQEFGDALRDVGFVAVKADSLNPILPNVWSDMKTYFEQSDDEKMKDFHHNFGQSGFAPYGYETAAKEPFPDEKQFYHVPPKWPDKFRTPPSSFYEFYHGVNPYIAKAMELIAEYLGEPTEDIAKSMEADNNLARFAYYPLSDDPNKIPARKHKDLNLLTGLPPANIPGLQLMSKHGKWINVVVPPGYLIINTGEELEKKTAGYIKATLHQVLNLGGIYSKMVRLASVFFGSWSKEFSLKPFDSCVQKMTQGMNEKEKQKYLEQYPDVTVDENLRSRLIEMGSIPNPDHAVVKDLLSKGLLQQPPQSLKVLYPDLFPSKK